MFGQFYNLKILLSCIILYASVHYILAQDFYSEEGETSIFNKESIKKFNSKNKEKFNFGNILKLNNNYPLRKSKKIKNDIDRPYWEVRTTQTKSYAYREYLDNDKREMHQGQFEYIEQDELSIKNNHNNHVLRISYTHNDETTCFNTIQLTDDIAVLFNNGLNIPKHMFPLCCNGKNLALDKNTQPTEDHMTQVFQRPTPSNKSSENTITTSTFQSENIATRLSSLPKSTISRSTASTNLMSNSTPTTNLISRSTSSTNLMSKSTSSTNLMSGSTPSTILMSKSTLSTNLKSSSNSQGPMTLPNTLLTNYGGIINVAVNVQCCQTPHCADSISPAVSITNPVTTEIQNVAPSSATTKSKVSIEELSRTTIKSLELGNYSPEHIEINKYNFVSPSSSIKEHPSFCNHTSKNNELTQPLQPELMQNTVGTSRLTFGDKSIPEGCPTHGTEYEEKHPIAIKPHRLLPFDITFKTTRRSTSKPQTHKKPLYLCEITNSVAKPWLPTRFPTITPFHGIWRKISFPHFGTKKEKQFNDVQVNRPNIFDSNSRISLTPKHHSLWNTANDKLENTIPKAMFQANLVNKLATKVEELHPHITELVKKRRDGDFSPNIIRLEDTTSAYHKTAERSHHSIAITHNIHETVTHEIYINESTAVSSGGYTSARTPEELTSRSVQNEGNIKMYKETAAFNESKKIVLSKFLRIGREHEVSENKSYIGSAAISTYQEPSMNTMGNGNISRPAMSLTNSEPAKLFSASNISIDKMLSLIKTEQFNSTTAKIEVSEPSQYSGNSRDNLLSSEEATFDSNRNEHAINLSKDKYLTGYRNKTVFYGNRKERLTDIKQFLTTQISKSLIYPSMVAFKNAPVVNNIAKLRTNEWEEFKNKNGKSNTTTEVLHPVNIGCGIVQFSFKSLWYITDGANLWAFESRLTNAYISKLVSSTTLEYEDDSKINQSYIQQLMDSKINEKDMDLRMKLVMPYELLAQHMLFFAKYNTHIGLEPLYIYNTLTLDAEDVIASLRLAAAESFTTDEYQLTWSSRRRLNWNWLIQEVNKANKKKGNKRHQYVFTSDVFLGKSNLFVYSNLTSTWGSQSTNPEKMLEQVMKSNNDTQFIPAEINSSYDMKGNDTFELFYKTILQKRMRLNRIYKEYDWKGLKFTWHKLLICLRSTDILPNSIRDNRFWKDNMVRIQQSKRTDYVDRIEYEINFVPEVQLIIVYMNESTVAKGKLLDFNQLEKLYGDKPHHN